MRPRIKESLTKIFGNNLDQDQLSKILPNNELTSINLYLENAKGTKSLTVAHHAGFMIHQILKRNGLSSLQVSKNFLNIKADKETNKYFEYGLQGVNNEELTNFLQQQQLQQSKNQSSRVIRQNRKL